MKKYIAIDDEAFDQIMSKLEDLENRLLPGNQETGIGWLNNRQFCQALQISNRSAQNYRDQKLINFSVVGGKVYYKKEDIETLLNKHYIKAK